MNETLVAYEARWKSEVNLVNKHDGFKRSYGGHPYLTYGYQTSSYLKSRAAFLQICLIILDASQTEALIMRHAVAYKNASQLGKKADNA